MAGGRPTKFTEDLQKQMKYLAERGFTEVQLAEALLIDPSTITKWKQKMPEFFTSLNDWKAIADMEVEKSLYQRATGYSHPETKAQFVDGEWKTIDMTKHYAPDSTSMIFWLKNRKKEWSDQQDIKITDDSKINTDEETLRRLAFMLRNKEEESPGAAGA